MKAFIMASSETFRPATFAGAGLCSGAIEGRGSIIAVDDKLDVASKSSNSRPLSCPSSCSSGHPLQKTTQSQAGKERKRVCKKEKSEDWKR
jgi:hypothetical protein